jgi:hypothetical protein
MAGLVPAIHVFLEAGPKTWMPGTSPGMTVCEPTSCSNQQHDANAISPSEGKDTRLTKET